MAEGGVAAALANVDDRDSWKVHFADTMRGGQNVNNWRMAELHAKEAPDRVRELEAWGAVFDRTADGKILQRNFGGHRYPRLAHVGDRTGLELIRTLQDQGVHRGLDVHMEFTVVALLTSDGRAAGRGRLRAGARAVQGVQRRSRDRARPAAPGRAYKITSNSWEGTGDGHSLAYHAGAELMDMEFIQFHPTGMIWPPSVQGILVTEGVRGEGGILLNSEGRRFMFDSIPEPYRNQTADNEDEGWRYTQGDKNARRPPELLTRDHVARCIMHEVKAGRGSPRGGVFLDISWIKKRLPNSEEIIRRKLPSMYHQFKQLADIDITKEPMEVGPTTHYIMGGVRVDARHADVDACRALCRGGMRRRESTAPTGLAATRCRTCSSSANGPESSRRSSRAQNRLARDRSGPGAGRRPRRRCARSRTRAAKIHMPCSRRSRK